MAIVEGSGTVVLADAVPLMLEVKAGKVPPAIEVMGGVTFANEKSMDRGGARSVPGITPEVNVTDSPTASLATCSVNPDPLPKTASVKVPDRKFVPVPPAPDVNEKVPIYGWVKFGATPVAAPMLVAERLRKAANGVVGGLTANVVMVTATSVPVTVVTPALTVAEIGFPPTAWPNARIVVAVARFDPLKAISAAAVAAIKPKNGLRCMDQSLSISLGQCSGDSKRRSETHILNT